MSLSISHLSLQTKVLLALSTILNPMTNEKWKMIYGKSWLPTYDKADRYFPAARFLTQNLFIVPPEARYLETVLNELPADTKMPPDLVSALAGEHKAA